MRKTILLPFLLFSLPLFAQSPPGAPCTARTLNTAYNDNVNNVAYLCVQNGSSYFWKANVGIGAPTVGCSAVNYGASYTDISGNVAYQCTQSGWTSAGTAGTPQAQNAKLYGAKADERDALDAVTTASSATITSTTANFTAADVGKSITIAMGQQGVLKAAYTSGITATGSTNQTCTITFAIPGGGTAATGYVRLTDTNTIAGGTTIFIAPNYGSGYTSAPTTATASSGTATCSGTATLTSTLVTYPVVTTISSVTNSTTAVLATNATTSGTGVHASIYTDNLAALQNWINACEAAGAVSTCYLPAGQYGYNGALSVASMIKIEGDGVTAGWGKPSQTGYSAVMPQFAPWLSGSVLVNESASQADGIDISSANTGIVLRDFGIRFSPATALWYTGYGIKSLAASSFGQNGGVWQNVAIWGTDGSHAGFRVNDIQLAYLSQLASYGGASLSLYANAASGCCVGNSIISNFYGEDMVGGGANALEETGTALTNLMHWERPQENGYGLPDMPSAPLASWAVPPPDPNQGSLIYFKPSDTHIVLSNPDFEGSANGINYNGGNLPGGPTNQVIGGNSGVLRIPFTDTGDGYASDPSLAACGTTMQLLFYGTGNTYPVPATNTGFIYNDCTNMHRGTWNYATVWSDDGTVESGGTQNVSGCGLSANVGGSMAGKFTSGTTGTCTATITLPAAAANGTECRGTDLNTGAVLAQTSSTTTTCVIAGTTTSGNTVTWSVRAY